jgi:hypothetical protein
VSRPSPAREPSSGAILIPAADRERVLKSPRVLGSDPAQADVVIDEPTVAPRHAVMMLDETDGSHWTIRDLGSAQGTFVDGERIDGERILTGRHEIVLGRHRMAIVVERAVHLVEAPSGFAMISRGTSMVALEPLELALIRLLATALDNDLDRPESMRGFVRSSDLAHLVPGAADLATPMIRQLARRLERKLAGLGEPPVLESCERRGYRLRARLVTEAG